MYSPELQMKIQAWRHKAAEDQLTQEEMREIISTLRGARGAVAPAVEGAAKAKATRAKAAKPNADLLLSELEGD